MSRKARGDQFDQPSEVDRRAEKCLVDVVGSGANRDYQQFYLAETLDPIKIEAGPGETGRPTKWHLKKRKELTAAQRRGEAKWQQSIAAKSMRYRSSTSLRL